MLLIYLPRHTPRSKYIFDKIFIEEFGISYQVTNEKHFFENYKGEKINYSGSRFNDDLFIKATSLLAENSIRERNITVSEFNGIKVLFANEKDCDLGFDVFSAVFYMIIRYEEYLPFIPDIYGRFDIKDSIAFKNNFLNIPIADYWIEILKGCLQKKFPSLSFRKSTFTSIVTYDIDVAYKFKGRSFMRNAGSFIKDIFKFDLKNISERKKVLKNLINDPWDTYDYLKQIIVKNNLNSIFFFLLSDESKHDRNLHYDNALTQQLIKNISSFSSIGIHPSFYASLSFEKISEEKQRLEKISASSITKSRQHFLKFKFPDTFNHLIKAGITEDYSMGIPYQTGFRAGTCKPFKFYDLKNDQLTNLTIFPITFMEGNFMKEKIFNKNEIIKTIENLFYEVKKMNGAFISIWHNHTISDTDEFREWKNIHEQMIQLIVKESS